MAEIAPVAAPAGTTVGTDANSALAANTTTSTGSGGTGSFEAALANLQATYEKIEEEAIQLRTLVAIQGEILAASKQAIQ